jgi:hypothetical protein
MKISSFIITLICLLLLACHQSFAQDTNKITATTNATSTISNTNKVATYKSGSPEDVWNHMKACLKAGNISGATSYFCSISKADYKEDFRKLTKEELRSAADGLTPIYPVSVGDDQAEYFFDSVIDGKTLSFKVTFVKESGKWKIMEY